MATIATRSLREELTVFVEDVLAKQDTVSVGKLVRMAHSHFNGDEWFVEALIHHALNQLVPEIAGDVRHRLRQSAIRSTDNGETRRARIQSIFEHVGGGYTKRITSMTRPEHLFAANEREGAAAGHLRWAGFHRAVAALHTDDTTKTDALPIDLVENLWREHIERDD